MDSEKQQELLKHSETLYKRFKNTIILYYNHNKIFLLSARQTESFRTGIPGKCDWRLPLQRETLRGILWWMTFQVHLSNSKIASLIRKFCT